MPGTGPVKPGDGARVDGEYRETDLDRPDLHHSPQRRDDPLHQSCPETGESGGKGQKGSPEFCICRGETSAASRRLMSPGEKGRLSKSRSPTFFVFSQRRGVFFFRSGG